MHWPKRFKLHEAAAPKADGELRTDVVQAHGYHFVAVDGVALAVVPILGPEERSGADLPRLEPGEDLPVGLLPPKMVQEASHGTKGSGLLRPFEEAVEAQRDVGKAWQRLPRPEADGRALPPYKEALKAARADASDGYRRVHLRLNAEALVRLSRALGCQEGVDLTFSMNEQTGAIDAAHGLILVEPVGEPPGGPQGVLAAVVTE